MNSEAQSNPAPQLHQTEPAQSKPVAVADAQSQPAASGLNQLVNGQPSSELPVLHSASGKPLVAPSQPTGAVVEAQTLPPPEQRRHIRRNGRIASLPKLYRDMVGRMVWNSVPYKNICAALFECGVSVTERNISNWATRGGFLEWRAEQELVLQNRLDQDHLVDHLRRDDASELSEAGLQAAATRISQILVQKTHRAEDIEGNLGRFSQMVDVLCRLNREIGILQKQRDDSRRSLGSAYNPVRIKEIDEGAVDGHERYYSNPPAESTLPKPPRAPALPPLRTCDFLASNDREAEHARKIEQMQEFNLTLKALAGKKPQPPTPQTQTPPSPPPNGHPR